MSMGYRMPLVRRNRSQMGAFAGQTYGLVGVPAYGPTIAQPSPMVPTATGHGTLRSGAVVTLGGLRTATASPYSGVAQIPYGAAPTQGGAQFASSAGGAGVGLATTLIGAAAAGSTVPVAGWIVAGGLVVTAGVVLLVDTFRKKGVAAARAEAAAKGYPQAFVVEYGKNATSKVQTVQRRKKTLAERVKAEQADVDKAKARLDKKPGDKSRKKAYQRQKRQLQEDIDRFNAASVVLGLKQTLPSDPVIAGMASTIPDQIEERGTFGDLVAGEYAGPLVLLASGAGAIALFAWMRPNRARIRTGSYYRIRSAA